MGVFEWRLSDKTKKANAALAGIGQTRRIIISDTLLAEHSDDEIEVILAHELAHHVHRDIWKGIALETVLIALGFYLADAVLARFAMSFGLTWQRGRCGAAAAACSPQVPCRWRSCRGQRVLSRATNVERIGMRSR
jgi:Zn-dependent protease with chaperone function